MRSASRNSYISGLAKAASPRKYSRFTIPRLAGDHRLQHRVPVGGAVHVARPQGAALNIPELVEHEQRMIAGAAKVAVVGAAFLLAVGRAFARIHVEHAEASIAAIDQGLILQHDAIDQARAALDSAKAERVRAALDHTRYVELARDAWAPRQRLETAAADAQKADASVAAAKAALASAQQQIEVLSAQRNEAGAKLGQAKAALDQARVDLDKTVKTAPVVYRASASALGSQSNRGGG